MLGVFGGTGTSRSTRPEGADVMLVNTCAVRDNAEQRVIGRLGELQQLQAAPARCSASSGCMAQRLGPRLLERVPKVDLVVGPDAYRNLPALVAQAARGQRVSDTEFRVLGALRGRAARPGDRGDGLRHGAARLRL